MKLIISIVTLLAGLSALADDPRGDTWIPFQMPIPNYQGTIAGYITDQGLVKIENFSEDLVSETQVWLPDYKTDRPDLYKLACQIYGKSKGQSEYQKEAVEMDVNVNPFSENNRAAILQYMISHGGKADAQSSFKNGPDFVDVSSVSIQVSGQDQPVYDVQALQQNILDQLKAQGDAIKTGGKATLRLDGYTNLICDLSSGKATLVVRSHYTLGGAKPKITSYIKSGEVTQMFQMMTSAPKSGISTIDKTILAAVRFGVAAARVWSNVDQTTPEKIVKLFGQLFDLASASWKSVAQINFTQVAQSIDDLNYELNLMTFANVTSHVSLHLGRRDQ